MIGRKLDLEKEKLQLLEAAREDLTAAEVALYAAGLRSTLVDVAFRAIHKALKEEACRP